MWGYQQQFRHSVGFDAESALREIGAGVGPVALLVGFRATPGAAFDYCLEPETEPIALSDLSGVPAKAAELFEADEESHMFHSHPLVHEIRMREVRDRARRDALCGALAASDAGAGRTYFASRSQPIGDYEVHAVIGVLTHRWDLLPSLTMRSRDRMKVVPSLAEAVVDEILRRASLAMALREPPDGITGETGSRTHDIIRAASHRFMESVAVLAGQWFGSQLHEHLDAVAAQPYEGRAGVGTIVLAGGDGSGGGPASEMVDVDVIFRRPVAVSETRAMRKVLEMSGPGLHVLSNGMELTGLGRISATYDPMTEGSFEVSIVSRGSWELKHNNVPLLRVDNTKAHLPQPRLAREHFADTVDRLFPEASSDVHGLWELAQAAAEQEHGTMLVVHRAAPDEAIRLVPQAMAIEPVQLTRESLRAITNIDGAVLLSPDALCHAVGVILDGTATGDGDPSRGARYNSAVRYLHAAGHECLVIIVSEDGMINLLPDLKPRVQRERIQQAVAELEDAARGDIDFEGFYRRRRHLESLSFYLSADQCARANEATAAVEQHRFETKGMTVTNSTFTPHDDMNETYFL